MKIRRRIQCLEEGKKKKGEEETENEVEKESGRQGLVIRHTSSPEQDERNQIT